MLSFTEYLTEQFFDQLIRGIVSPVNSVGIITAENPNFNKLTQTGNERKNKALEADLEKLGFAPIQMQGKFAGVNEKPFLVINISREKLIELGKKHKQDFVIYGEKVGKKPFKFAFIRNGKTVKSGKLGLEHPKNLGENDCYFKLSGKKFNIRFT